MCSPLQEHSCRRRLAQSSDRMDLAGRCPSSELRESNLATTVVDIGRLIVRTPDVRGDRPRIAGTGVTVQRTVGWYKLGLPPEEIVEEYGRLTLAQVHAGLAYYHANREEIETAISADEAEAVRLAGGEDGRWITRVRRRDDRR